jgi:2-methylaconitate cis-trans-isomerase PrpF
MTAAIGLFSIDNSLLKELIIEPISNPVPTFYTVRIFNTNTRKVIYSTFLVLEDSLKFHPEGAYKMAGVVDAASRICLLFISAEGT